MAGRVIVTGGSRGIGKGIVKHLAQEGWEVAFNYRSSKECAENIVKEVQDNGGKAHAFQADISDFDQCKAFVDSAMEKMGEVDGLVNNAGITKDKNLFLMEQEDWHSVIDINLTGYFNVTRQIITYFMKNKRGNIVNISSVSGLVGLSGQTNYCASKSGIIGFTRALSKECGRAGIPVNAVAPGFIETDMTESLGDKHRKEIKKQVPMKRLGSVKEVSELVSFLLSGKAGYITGQVIPIDGGMTA